MRAITYQFLHMQEEYFSENKKDNWTVEELRKSGKDLKVLREPVLAEMSKEDFDDLVKNYPTTTEGKMSLKKQWEKQNATGNENEKNRAR